MGRTWQLWFALILLLIAGVGTFYLIGGTVPFNLSGSSDSGGGGAATETGGGAPAIGGGGSGVFGASTGSDLSSDTLGKPSPTASPGLGSQSTTTINAVKGAGAGAVAPPVYAQPSSLVPQTPVVVPPQAPSITLPNTGYTPATYAPMAPNATAVPTAHPTPSPQPSPRTPAPQPSPTVSGNVQPSSTPSP